MPNIADTIIQVGQFSLMAIAGWLAIILFLSLVDHPPRTNLPTDERPSEKSDADETEQL